MEHIVELGEKRNGHKRPVRVDGVLYDSVSAVYWKYGIYESAVYKLRKSGMSYADAVSYEISRAERNRAEAAERREAWSKDNEIRRERAESKRFKYNGLIYRDLNHACRMVGDHYGMTLNPAVIRNKAKAGDVRQTFIGHVTWKLKRSYLNGRKAKKRVGKFYGLRMKDIYRLMEFYVLKGGYRNVLSTGYKEYLASEVRITKKEALWFIKDYCEWLTLVKGKDFTEKLKAEADWGFGMIKEWR